MREFERPWQGTDQHGEASDISRWLVHLTRSQDELISILTTGEIRPRLPYGVGRSYSAVSHLHHSVCLTEIPLHELGRMTTKRPWGIVFDKERLRAKFDAQPVWYLSNPSPQWDAVKAAMHEARDDPHAPIWAMTPFIEGVRSRRSRYPHDWRWEREWRVPGILEFDLDDVARIVVDHNGALAFFDELPIEVPWVSPGDPTVRWSGGLPPGPGGFFTRQSDTTGDMLERFGGQFITLDAAGGGWDRENQVYFASAEILTTPDAIEEAFGYLEAELYEAIYGELNGTSTLWCRVFDLAHSFE